MIKMLIAAVLFCNVPFHAVPVPAQTVSEDAASDIPARNISEDAVSGAGSEETVSGPELEEIMPEQAVSLDFISGDSILEEHAGEKLPGNTGISDISHLLYQEGGFPSPDEMQVPEEKAKEAAAFFKSTVSAIECGEIFSESGTDISEYGLDRQTADILLALLINDRPEWFFLDGYYAYGSDKEGRLLSIKLFTKKQFGDGEDVAVQASSVFEQRISQIMDGMESCWSSEEKALYIHNWLVMNVEYDYTFKKYTAYNAIVDGSCVCNGYAMAYKCLLDRLGIPCDFVLSRRMNHGWNRIKVGGKYYFVDCTWDDGTGKNCYYHDFMVSRDSLHESHTSTDWVVCHHIENYELAYWDNWEDVYNNDKSSKDHDVYFWSNLNSPPIPDGNRWVYEGYEGYYIHDYGNGSDALAYPYAGWSHEYKRSWSYGNPVAFYDGMLVVPSHEMPGLALYDIDQKRTEATYRLTDEEYDFGQIYEISSKGNRTYFILIAYKSSYKDPVEYRAGFVDWRDCYSLSVDFVRGSDILKTLTVSSGEVISKAEIPDFSGDPDFVGWYAGSERWNSSLPVTRSLVLKARFMNEETDEYRSGADNYLSPKNRSGLLLIKGQKVYLDPSKEWASSKTSVLSVKKGYILNPKKTGTVSLTGGEAVTVSVNICTAELDRKKLALHTGNSKKLSIRLKGNEAADPSLLRTVWISSNPAVATVKDGRVYAEGAGKAVIYAYANGKKLSCKVTVSDSFRQGFMEDIVVMAPLQQASIRTREKFSPKNAVWTSSLSMNEIKNEKGKVIGWQDGVARISKDGKLTAMGTGVTTLTGTDGKGRRITFSLAVEQAVKGSIYMNAGSKKTLSPYKVKAKKAEWKVQNASIAHEEKGKLLSGTRPGVTVLTGSYAPYAEGSPLKYGYNVFVEDPSWTGGEKLVKTDAKGRTYALTLEQGQALRLTSKGIYQDVLFTSSSCTTAFMDGAGIVYARNKGKAVLTTKINSRTYKIRVEVK
ncbi:MAG: hypothetical protein K6F35_02195 [Lachnospiraceae bacterium]|nr:hypothetical protein [Lachnospiraceae bacterium]